jgi:hypothetical protein
VPTAERAAAAFLTVATRGAASAIPEGFSRRSDADDFGVASAVGLGPVIRLLLVVIVRSVWYAGWRLRTLRLTSDE